MESLEEIINKAKAYDEMCEKRKTKSREQQLRHRETILDKRKTYYRRNRDEVLERQKQQQRDNRERILERIRRKKEEEASRGEEAEGEQNEPIDEDDLVNDVMDEYEEEEEWNSSFSRKNEKNLLA